MDDYYYSLFEPPQKKLNIKKVIIISVVVIIIILIVLLFSSPKKEKEDNLQFVAEQVDTNSIFYDINRSISVELSNAYELKQYDSEGKYLIELRSKNNTNIFISKKDKLESKNLSSVVTADKIAFTESFGTYSNLSDLKDLIINNNSAYTYSFHYLDPNLNIAFYIQIIWLEIGNNYYIFDVEFPLSDLLLNSNLITDTLIYFKEQP